MSKNICICFFFSQTNATNKLAEIKLNESTDIVYALKYRVLLYKDIILHG